MVKRTIKPQFFTTNTTILPDGVAGIYFENTGNDTVYVFDQIPILAGASFDIPAQFADQVLVDSISIRFAGVGNNPQLLVIKTFIIN